MAKNKTGRRRRKGSAGKKHLQLLFRDATIDSVRVDGQWYGVKLGSWRVDLRGPYMHASWLSHDKTRYSAFIAHVQMVRHR